MKKTPTEQEIKPKADKQDCMKLKGFCTEKEAVKGRDNLQNEGPFLLAYV